MKFIVYEDSCFYYFWKDHNIPSTFGKQKSFLDYLLKSKDPFISQIVIYLQDMFGIENELGLLNRLDNDTAGLLIFAKTPLIKSKYKEFQSKGETIKYYITDVYGEFKQNHLKINSPIGHHKFSKDRIVVCYNKKQSNKVDQRKTKNTSTCIKKLYYDGDNRTTTLLVTISKGFKHQIRGHLSSIGFPIVGEKLYIKKPSTKNLQLYSIGVQCKF